MGFGKKKRCCYLSLLFDEFVVRRRGGGEKKERDEKKRVLFSLGKWCNQRTLTHDVTCSPCLACLHNLIVSFNEEAIFETRAFTDPVRQHETVLS